jgi:His/Glu/Gln/Arg/opine family amino acid ABC transporter permease subunit
LEFSELSPLRIALELLKGFAVSIELAALVLVISGILGFLGGLLATTASRVVRVAIHTAVIVFRGIPLLFQVFAIFYILPLVGPRLSPFVTATVALSLFGSLTITEIVRGAISAISARQMEGSLALGLRPTQAMVSVILPQAMRDDRTFAGGSIRLAHQGNFDHLLARRSGAHVHGPRDYRTDTARVRGHGHRMALLHGNMLSGICVGTAHRSEAACAGVPYCRWAGSRVNPRIAN